jgi:hypothetical protein
MRRISKIASCSMALAFVPVLAAACGGNPSDDASESVSESELRALKPAEIVGPIASGQTVGPIPYSKQPNFRALSFSGAKGDNVDIWVRSSDGDARAWLTSSAFTTLATSDDAAPGVRDAHLVHTLTNAGTYYIVWREKNLAASSFSVSLNVPLNGGAPPAFTAAQGTYSLTGSCEIVGSGRPAEAATALVVVTTNPDGTEPRLELVSLSDAGGYVPLPVTTQALTADGGTLAYWYYTEVQNVVRKSGRIVLVGTAPSRSLLVEGSFWIQGSVGQSTRRCSFPFEAPFGGSVPVPSTLAHGVPLAAAGTCTSAEEFSYACVQGTAGRDANGCCKASQSWTLADSIAFQIDGTNGVEELRVLRAPEQTPSVAGLVVEGSGGQFVAAPSFSASFQQGAFVVTTVAETSEGYQFHCHERVVRTTCRLVLAP